jgi:ABC-type sugar transport system ATPase subunit
VIHQEFSLVGQLSVAENLALGDEPRVGPWINRRSIRRRAAAQLSALAFPVAPNARTETLTTGQRQLVEIAKALGRNARILVLDEPTAALTRAEGARLFEVLNDLKRQGLAIVYISHHLDEVFAIADRITVLRDGSRVGTWDTVETSLDRIMAAMVGEVVDVRRAEPRHAKGRPLLEVKQAVGKTLGATDLSLYPGEVVGLTGLAGAGHEELAQIVFGAARLEGGSMTWRGGSYQPKHPAEARAMGIASVPADRRREGLVPTLSVVDNLALAALPRLSRFGWLNRRLRQREATRWSREFAIAHAGLGQPATQLSGGNQQKVLLARWSATEPSLLILNDPTRGIDVRTREEIHRRIENWAIVGQAILLVTSDTQELLRLADRVLVFRAGRVVRELPAEQVDEHVLLAAMLDETPAPREVR